MRQERAQGRLPPTRRLGRASEAAPGSNQPHDQQEQDGADRRIDDFRDEATTDMDTKLWKQITGDQRAGDTDENIPDNAKAGAAHNLSGQPARDKPDEQDNKNAFVRYVHENPPLVRANPPAPGGNLSIIVGRDDSKLSAQGECPDSEVRIIVRRPRLRTSESK